MYLYYPNFINPYFYLYIRRQLKKDISFLFQPHADLVQLSTQINKHWKSTV